MTTMFTVNDPPANSTEIGGRVPQSISDRILRIGQVFWRLVRCIQRRPESIDLFDTVKHVWFAVCGSRYNV